MTHRRWPTKLFGVLIGPTGDAIGFDTRPRPPSVSSDVAASRQAGREPQWSLPAHPPISTARALRDYQVLTPLPADEPAPPEEAKERRFLLDNHIPAQERAHYPLPTFFERDVLTNKGTFFAAKREDQLVERRVRIFQTVPDLNSLSLAELTERALPLVRVAATR